MNVRFINHCRNPAQSIFQTRSKKRHIYPHYKKRRPGSKVILKILRKNVEKDFENTADVLGAVIEKAPGMRFGEFMEKNIFELLGGGSLNGVRVMNQATVDYFTDGGLTPDQQKSYRAWVGLEGFTYSHLMRILKEI